MFPECLEARTAEIPNSEKLHDVCSFEEDVDEGLVFRIDQNKPSGEYGSDYDR